MVWLGGRGSCWRLGIALAAVLSGSAAAAELPRSVWKGGPASPGRGALVPPSWVHRPPTRAGALRASWEALLFAQLDEGDRRWLPTARRLPDGRTRYSYRRRQGEPPLTLPQIKALISNPPSFTAERQAIAGLLEQLRILGVSVELEAVPGARRRRRMASGQRHGEDPAGRARTGQPGVRTGAQP